MESSGVLKMVEQLLKVSVVVLVASLFIGLGIPETTATPGDRLQRCGSQLANQLEEICKGRGFNQMRGKRFENSGILQLSEFIRPRMRRGVVEECCRRKCSYQTLESYCAAPGSGSTRSPLATKFWSKPFATAKNRGRLAMGTDRPSVQEAAIRQQAFRENPLVRLQNGFFFVVNQTNRGE